MDLDILNGWDDFFDGCEVCVGCETFPYRPGGWGNMRMPAIDIEQFFDQSLQNYFFKKRFGYWETEKDSVVQKKNVHADELVKVIHDGKVVWFTLAEAQRMLEDCKDSAKSNASFKASLEKALRGSSRSLAEEIRVLFNLAIQTLSQRIQEGAIGDEEAEELTNSLRRRFETAEENVEDLLDLEKELTERKRAEPIFASYERKLAEFMNLQKSGNSVAAASLAKQLIQEKKHYLLRSRSLEPLTYAAYYYRLDLQKHKSRVLDTQRHLCEMRDSLVQHELGKLRQSMGDGGNKLFEDLETLQLSPEQSEGVTGYRRELKALAMESKVLVRAIQEVDQICEWIEKEIFKDENLKNVAITQTQKRKTAREQVREEGNKGSAGRGMVVMDRLQKRRDGK